MNRKSLKILVLVGFLLSLAAACGKVDRAKKNYIDCSREIIEFSKTIDPKSGSYLEQLEQKLTEIGNKYNFQGISRLKAAYKKYIKDSDPRLGEILQKIENVQPGKISNEIPPVTSTDIDKILGKHEKKKAEDEKSFFIGCERCDKGRVLYFLDKGVDINARDEKTGKTGLHYAVEKLNTEIVKLLLAKGADFDLRSKDGYAPIHLAVKPPNNIYFINPVEVKTKQSEIIDLLLQAGADVNAQTGKEGFNVLGIYLLNTFEILLTPSGSEPLKLNDAFIDFLLKKGININARTTADLDLTEIFIPTGSTLLDILSAIEVQRVIDFLKKNGAKHGTWAKYYLEGVDKKDLIDSKDSKEKPVKKPVVPPAAKDKPKGEPGKGEKSPSEVVVAAYMAGNKGEYSETQKYIHSEVLFPILSSGGMHKLKELWDEVTRNGNIDRIEILSEDIRGERAVVFLKILFKDGKKEVVKEKLLKDYMGTGWKLAGAE